MPRAARPAPRLILDRSLSDLAYRCYPDGCPRGRTCCMGLAVEVSRREVRAIDSLMDELARLIPSLREGDDYASVFIDDSPNLLIEPDEKGACPFLLRTRTHALCSIHHLALATGRSVPAHKPASCRHWPLVLAAEGDAVRVLVEPAARRIGCVAPRRELPGQPSVLDAFRDEIDEMCGKSSRRVRARGRRAGA